MRIWVPTRNRPEAFPLMTGALGLDVVPVVDGASQARLYRVHWPGEIRVNRDSAPPRCGKAAAINSVLRETPEGHWAIFADDDIRHVTGVPPGAEGAAAEMCADESRIQDWAALVRTELNAGQIERLLERAMRESEKVGANLVGFAPYDHPLYRRGGGRYRHWSLVVGDMFCIRRTDRLMPVKHIEDIFATAEALEADGSVVVDMWTRPGARHWQSGGHGRKEARRAYRQAEVEELVERWPHLFSARIGFGGDAKMANVRLRPRRRG